MFETLIHDHAATAPEDTAFRTPTGPTVTYATVALDVRRCAAWLAQQGVAPGMRAMLQVDDPYLHWVLFLALDMHGVVSIGDMATAPLNPALVDGLGASLVFSSIPNQAFAKARTFLIDGEWIGSMRACDAAPLSDRSLHDDDPVCIVFSSGTTGAPKKVLLTRGMIDRRTLHAREAGFLRPGARIACLLPFQSIGGILAVFQAWLVGGSICWPSHALNWSKAIAVGAFDTWVAAPIHLERILSILPQDFRRPDGLVILAGGGALSRPLAAALRQRLTDEIVVAYGSTEMGLVTKATIDQITGAEESAGPILPWMQVEVIDEVGNACPSGKSGELRVRGDDVVTGYFEDEAETARYFRDGWYHPGDVGHIDSAGILTVSGRVDELINIGGRKAVPAAIEAVALQLPGVADVAAFAAPFSGETQLWVAYATDRALPPATFAPLLRYFPAVRIAPMDALPRNAMGKVERRALAAKAAEGSLASELVVPEMAETEAS